MRKDRYTTLILLLLLLIITPGYSQSGHVQIRSVSFEDGLSNTNIQCIVQDSTGFMWFGSSDGLNRYDGYEIKTYYRKEGDKNSLLSSNIRSLFVDKEGQLWIGTSKGLCRYDPAQDHFIAVLAENNTSLGEYDIVNIMNDNDGYLWLSSYRVGLIRYKPRDGSLTRYRHDHLDPTSISSDVVYSSFQDSRGNIWATTHDGGVNLYHPDKGNFTRYMHNPDDPESILGNNVHVMAESPDGNLWFACNYAGLSTLAMDKIPEGKFTNLTHTGNPAGLINNNTRIICAAKKGGLWIGTELGQLEYYQGGTFNHYQIKTDNSPGIGLFNALYVDRENNLWVGSSYAGVFLVHHTSRAFKSFDTKNGLSNNEVWEFAEDQQGLIWIATDGGGLNCFNPEKERFTIFNSQNTNLVNDHVLTVFVDSENQVWTGCWGGGLSLFDRSTDRFQNFNATNSQLSSNNVFDITEDQDGNLWIATQNGLNKYLKKTGEFRVYTKDNSGLPFNQIEVVETDLQGNILIGNVNGLIIYSPFTSEWKSFHRQTGNAFSLSNDFVTSILAEDSSTLWVATHFGLNKLDRQTGRFNRFFMKDGLPSDIIYGLEKDENGDFWISTNRGLVRMDPWANAIKTFGPSDGLQDYIFLKKSHLRAKNGLLYFGGINGFNVVDPTQVRHETFSAPVIFTQLMVNHKPVSPNDETGILLQTLNQTDHITLTHRYQNFTIQFSALEYTKTDAVQYAYKLEGYDKEWNYNGKLRSATYTNLNEGDYTLLVKSFADSPGENGNTISLRITVLPPWWKTILFRVLIIIFLILLLVTIYFLRVRKFRIQKQALEKEVGLRTNELRISNEKLQIEQEKLWQTNSMLEETQHEILTQKEELENHRNHLESLITERTAELLAAKEKAEESDRLKTAFLANLSHEIRTPLNAITGFSSLLATTELTREEKKKFIEMIISNSDSLTLLINDIIDISLIESKQLKLNNEPFDVNLIIEELLDHYSSLNTKEIQFLFEKKSKEREMIIMGDHARFKQTLNNLIGNACKYTDKGSIRIGYESNEKEIRFYVSDTGIGIQPSDQQSIFSRFHKLDTSQEKIYRGVGIGLTICSHLIELMKGKIWVESVPGEGSTFIFTLPTPLNKPVQVPDSDRSSNSPDLSSYTILVAEDDSTNYILIEKFLKDTRARVIWAKNGQEAVEEVKNFRDRDRLIILMDIKMPVMNGFEALRQIRNKFKTIPIVAVTAYAQEKDRLEILKNNFDGYVTKPIMRKILLETIRKAIEK
ncbi:MAG: response regulator [Bacteroidales bacterium]|nr:response regulator [Bacteroidales bacterium]